MKRPRLASLQDALDLQRIPGFRYAPPWAEVYRHFVASIHSECAVSLRYSAYFGLDFIPRVRRQEVLLFGDPV